MKVAIIGDSIAEGLGVQGCSYGDTLCVLQKKTGTNVDLLNLAHTGYQISDSAHLLPKLYAFAPDLVIIAHGVTEAIIRPNQNAMRFVPPRWRQKGWLDPRPYYSRHWLKRLPQQIESTLRWRWKVCLLKVFGGETWMSETIFSEKLNACLDAILIQTSANIILLTQAGLDEKFYPGSPASLERYCDTIKQIAHSHKSNSRAYLCDISQLLDEWGDFFCDHFHPNREGHNKIANTLHEFINKQSLSATFSFHKD